jgi:hypothetical protein
MTLLGQETKYQITDFVAIFVAEFSTNHRSGLQEGKMVIFS